jgi:hypothetical protein
VYLLLAVVKLIDADLFSRMKDNDDDHLPVFAIVVHLSFIVHDRCSSFMFDSCSLASRLIFLSIIGHENEHDALHRHVPCRSMRH